MGALVLSGFGLSQGNVVKGGDNAPSLKVEWNADRTQCRVNVGTMQYGGCVNTASDTKAVLVLLREMYDTPRVVASLPNKSVPRCWTARIARRWMGI